MTWVLFGCSPFINQIPIEILKAIAEKYVCIAVNRFQTVQSDFRLIYDHIPEVLNCPELLLINEKILKYNPETPHWKTYKPSISLSLKNDGTLYGIQSVVTNAIHFAFLNGAKRIILVGVDFNWREGHYYSPEKYLKPDDAMAELLMNMRTLNSLPDFEIIQTNPDSKLLKFLKHKDINEFV